MAPRMNDPNTRRIIRIVIDLLCLLIVSLPVGILRFAAHPYRRGFFCDDESLMRPYKKTSVSYILVVVISVGATCIAVIVTEFTLYWNRKDRQLLPHFNIGKLKLNSCLVEMYQVIGIFLFGVGVSQSFMTAGKYTVGRLRPHFFDVCKPDIRRMNCTTPMARYVLDYECTAEDKERIEEARMSFPSGHSSCAFYAMVYLMLYLQARMTWAGSRLLRHVIQVTGLMLASLCGISRVSDYKHHWSDVFAGALLGSTVAFAMIYGVSDLYTATDPSSRGDITRKSSSVPLSPFRKSTARRHSSRGSGGSATSGENQANSSTTGAGTASTSTRQTQAGSHPTTLQEVQAI